MIVSAIKLQMTVFLKRSQGVAVYYIITRGTDRTLLMTYEVISLALPFDVWFGSILFKLFRRNLKITQRRKLIILYYKCQSFVCIMTYNYLHYIILFI